MVFILFIPTITSIFCSKLPDLLVNKYDKEALTKSIDFSTHISKLLLTNENYQKNIKGLSSKDLELLLENQIRLFKDLMIDNSQSYLEVEEAYELLDRIFLDISALLIKTPHTVYGLEDSIIYARRQWRKNKEWVDNSWRSASENLLIEIEGLEDKKVELIIDTMKNILDVVLKEVEELKKKNTIKLSFNNKEKMFIEGKANMGKEEVIAFLTIDPVNNNAKLIFTAETSIVDKRTAERQATSICKTGFLMHDGRRVGMGCSLEEIDEYASEQPQLEN